MTCEVAEELQLREDLDFAVASQPAIHLEYTDRSDGARGQTACVTELFEACVALQGVLGTIEANTTNRWLTTAEIDEKLTRDSQLVSRTMRFLLQNIGSIATKEP